MARRRVVITGMGVLSALGRNVPDHWQALVEGRSGIAPLEAVDSAQLSFSNAAEVRGFDPGDYFPNRADRELDRFAHFAMIAAAEAIADSGLAWEEDEELKSRTAVVTGSCTGGQVTTEAQYHKLLVQGAKRSHPHSIPRIMANAGASLISMRHGLRGPAFTLSTACSSSNHAIGLAYWLVRDGAADVAITGGSEGEFTFGMMKAWDALRVVSPDTCRPFSLNRPGMILGEGGAMLVLETLEHAAARGARIYAEVAGFGMTADAHHLTMPSVDGPARAMAMALGDGEIAKETVGYINAHGTGTAANDPNETRAIRRVFGSHADSLAVSSTKSLHGHTLGAAGAIEAIATVMALHRGTLPPTANFTEPDPECDLDVVPNQARVQQVEAALSNSFAFGGLNAVVAFKRHL